MQHSHHFHAVRLPDGTAAEQGWVVDGRVSVRPVPGARDLPGGWFLPGGLVDAHLHLTMNFDKVMPFDDGSDPLMAANAAALIEAGVLAVRDAGCAWGGVPRPRLAGPRLQRAGALLCAPERGYPGVCRAVDAEALVRVALDDVAAGASWVKVLADFPGPDGNWFAAPPAFPRAVIARLVREVHAAGARVMAHSTGLAAPDLVAAGVDSIEHGMALTPDLVHAMADGGIAWTTTLGTALKHVGSLAAQPTAVGTYLRHRLDNVRTLLPMAVSLGVPVLAGTDELPMGAVAAEISQLIEFGLSPAQALAAGSTTARSHLRFPSWRDGAPADVVMFDADPRVTPAVLKRPSAVVFDGVRVV